VKVTVTKYLNVRVGSASVNAPNYQYLAPGTELEVLDQVFIGDEYEGDVRWLKDEANNYYWIGGTDYDELKEAKLLNSNMSNEDYTKFLNQYPGKGEDIGVAILDSGILTEHPILKSKIAHYEDLLSQPISQNISNHGTKVAGIITSDDLTSARNQSDIYCFRIANKSNAVDSSMVLTALKKILNEENLNSKISLINMSLDIIVDYVPHLQIVIDQLLNKGILCVVAAGEGVETNATANLENVIKVGIFNAGEKLFSKKIDFAFLNQPIFSYGLNSAVLNKKISRDSAYCAFTTSLLARYQKQQNFASWNLQLAIDYLNSISDSLKESALVQPFIPYTL